MNHPTLHDHAYEWTSWYHFMGFFMQTVAQCMGFDRIDMLKLVNLIDGIWVNDHLFEYGGSQTDRIRA